MSAPPIVSTSRLCRCGVRPMARFSRGLAWCATCRHASIDRTEANRRYRARHPEKVQARNAIAHAIERHGMTPAKELSCFDCGAPAARYDHFLGYARIHWLDVQPVCVRCCARRESTRHAANGGVA